MTSSEKTHPLRALSRSLQQFPYVWIFALSLALRLIYLAQAFQSNELIDKPSVDAHMYVHCARALLAGGWPEHDYLNITPAIPLWIAFWILILGWNPLLHYIVFHLMGAIQGIIIGKTAARLWDAKTGVATALLASFYWPFIIFEASYYAEAFALFNLSIALYYLVRWQQNQTSRKLLFWSGVGLGFSILARANTILCLPLLAAWVFWKVYHSGMRLRNAVLFSLLLALPTVLICLPVVIWRWQITGKPMLRAHGWLAIYLGNIPEFRAVAPPVGVRWREVTYRPIRAGLIDVAGQESFWKTETARYFKEGAPGWLPLMGRKSLMLAGRFEVSQEIDIYVFRNASSVLSLPIWPGWGTVAPLALFAIVSMCWSCSPRSALPLLLFGLAYFASLVPVQIAGRYRLPLAVPLLPLAGWTLVTIIGAIQRRERKTLASAAITILASGTVIWPDWLRLHDEKIINHWFLVGEARQSGGDRPGALLAFETARQWDSSNPDCPLKIAAIYLATGEMEKAESMFTESHVLFPLGHEAIIGIGECALVKNDPAGALRQAAKALPLAPNNMEALDLACRAFAKLENWASMIKVCRELRTYITYPASAAFTEAWAQIRSGNPSEALRVYKEIAKTSRFNKLDQDRAAYLAGVLELRLSGEKAKAAEYWTPLRQSSSSFFRILAEILTGNGLTPALEQALPADLPVRSRQFIDYSVALRAREENDLQSARTRLQQVVDARNALQLPLSEQDVLEILAIEDLKTLPAGK